MARSTSKSTKPAKKPAQEANGSLPRAESSVAATVAPNEARAASNGPSKHQTHGGYTPVQGPITSVDQLRRGPNLSKGSVGSFSTLGSYSEYLHNLTLADLHKHAVERGGTVPIDDRLRLIRRLETGWSEVAAREGILPPPPKREPFTPEQLATQAEIRRKLLRHLA